MMLSLNFQKGWGPEQKKNPSLGEVWIFYGTTHFASETETMKILLCTDFYTHDTFTIKHIKQTFLMIKTSSINSIVIWEVKIELVLLGYQWKDASVGNYIPR